LKTTLEIPDDLYRAIKIQAAQNGETLTKLVTRGLNLVLGKVEESRMPEALEKLTKKPKVAEWLKTEEVFLDSMRGQVYGESALVDLGRSRR